MKSASSALLKAIGERLESAFVAASEVCPWSVAPNPNKPLPYGVLGADTEHDGFSTKNTYGSVITHTLRIYSESDAKTRQLASIAIEAITDNPLVFESDFYQAGKVRLEMNQVIKERDERGDIYGAAIRFRFLIGQY